MRRVGNLWEGIVSFDNLLSAAWRAALGKRRVAGVARFLERLEPEVLALQCDLKSGNYKPGRSFTFRVLDPKERTITAAPFRDRVVHHALIDPLEPIFERRMMPESFACRRGKGTHAALTAARRLVQHHGYFLKLDIRRCFGSLDHGVVLETLRRITKDRRVLDLCEVIVRHQSPGEPRERGIPIGNLTSQWFANLVLDRLDHHVKEVLGIPGYVRYMDDFALFEEDKQVLTRALGEVEEFLADPLKLSLKKEVTLLAPVSQGMPFLGWRIYRGTSRLRPANIRRTRRRLKQRIWEFNRGFMDEASLAGSIRSVIAHLKDGQTHGLRRTWFEGNFENLRAKRPIHNPRKARKD